MGRNNSLVGLRLQVPYQIQQTSSLALLLKKKGTVGDKILN